MAKRMQSWFVDRVASNLSKPQNDFFGRTTTKILLKLNAYLEKNAVRLCNIKPDDKVLEVGFGPGYGLEAAYQKVKGGRGQIYGIDTSLYMVNLAGRRVRKGVQDKRVLLFHGSAAQIPLDTDSIDRVFHTNCYQFWPSLRVVMREIYRVMKPGAVMVTVLSIEQLKYAKEYGFMKYGNCDRVKYMTCLEKYGFEGVHIEFLNDEKTGKPYQAIFAEVNEKPAHHADTLSDGSDEEEEETPKMPTEKRPSK